ncbi:5-methylthioadenosine/S-adenosylhomocysteine deaminase [Methylobacillus rhizosphaerae]|uniref:5-methylthioadenosine/S-adenosylhomocysteine deaminase n=1 Tax=Methylobacillus rhizosphaerae TaxID=551994 RepID=A0A238ZQR7_9PROT|nr:TRZ/ATZ family hydrolase [Methylobacillus rhizosphaerae]SNR85747.1 5-methylthioadenosine/S-adenosylhomocysteine deaminase [Methylobacillus rhizosphaerae]
MNKNSPHTAEEVASSAALQALDAHWVVPVVPYGQVLEYHSVILDGQKILDILSTEQARQRYPAASVVTLDEHVLIPGLINLHTHAAMSLMRGFADDQPLMSWLQEYIWPAEKKYVSEQFVRDGTLLGCAEMLAGGTTCFSDMYFFPQAVADAALQAGMRANVGLVVMEFATAYAHDAEDYLQKGLQARDSWRDQPLLSASFAPHAPYTVSNRTFEQVVTYAEQLGLNIHTHLHETREEISSSLKEYGVHPLQRLESLGVLGPNLVAAHGVHLTETEMQKLAAYGCHIAHCPASNLKLASGMAPVAALQAAGVNVAIGTDGAASNNRQDMFAEMRLAALLAKGVSGDAASVPAMDALAMATLNAAKALGLDQQIGSLEVGKCADVIALKLSAIEIQPCFNVVSHLVYSAGREHVTHVWVNGDLKYQKLEGQAGMYANIEPAELKEISSKWQTRLSQ